MQITRRDFLEAVMVVSAYKALEGVAFAGGYEKHYKFRGDVKIWDTVTVPFIKVDATLDVLIDGTTYTATLKVFPTGNENAPYYHHTAFGLSGRKLMPKTSSVRRDFPWYTRIVGAYRKDASELTFEYPMDKEAFFSGSDKDVRGKVTLIPQTSLVGKYVGATDILTAIVQKMMDARHKREIAREIPVVGNKGNLNMANAQFGDGEVKITPNDSSIHFESARVQLDQNSEPTQIAIDKINNKATITVIRII